MNPQFLEPREDTPIVIETPLGFIEITTVDIKRRLKLAITLPGTMKATRGWERAVKATRWVVRSNGGSKPKYRMLVPVLEGGCIVDLREPEAIEVRVAPARSATT